MTLMIVISLTVSPSAGDGQTESLWIQSEVDAWNSRLNGWAASDHHGLRLLTGHWNSEGGDLRI